MSLRTAGPVLSRRQAIAAGGLAGLAVAAPVALPRRADAAPAATPLGALPRLYGTPTAIARGAAQQVWTREPDGTVVTWDRRRGLWTVDRQRWATVLTYGTAHLLRWSRPSGVELVVVLGTAPQPPGPSTAPTSTAPSTGTTSPGSTPPTTTRAPTSTVRTTAVRTTAAPTAPGGSGRSLPPSAQSPQLADTGVDIGPLAVAGGVLVAVGGVLQAVRSRAVRVGRRERDSRPPP
ncbi:hypothetical protein [Nakamurella endophytica]|uniref:Uncharacterized protein n=1 Tax=Nakamurella endophytica TaxID=1748367 RepID=A0A917T5E0_9ACTN|nr:hypothetical protein [Nakamurella endophytica]GGM10795.1 hypothetical protein GCM10011594_33410 [Nakamurella endophytica]